MASPEPPPRWPLIADLSATFVNLCPHAVDRACGDALERLGRFFGVDLCALLEIKDGKLHPVHVWAAEELDESEHPRPSFSELQQHLGRGETVLFCKSNGFSDRRPCESGCRGRVTQYRDAK